MVYSYQQHISKNAVWVLKRFNFVFILCFRLDANESVIINCRRVPRIKPLTYYRASEIKDLPAGKENELHTTTRSSDGKAQLLLNKYVTTSDAVT